jgi:hypothetical protein
MEDIMWMHWVKMENTPSKTLCWEHKDTMRMHSVNQEVVNPKKGRKNRWWKHLGWLPRRNVNKDVDICKVGESDMPF